MIAAKPFASWVLRRLRGGSGPRDGHGLSASKVEPRQHGDNGPRGPRQPPVAAPAPRPTDAALARDRPWGPAADLVVRALGGTDVWVRGHRVEHWGSRRGQMVFRYVLWQRHPVQREILMDLLWPGATPESARNNLNVAIYGLRRTLEVGGPGRYLVHRDGSYVLAPELTIWCDFEEFEARRQDAQASLTEGRRGDADRHLSRAAELYGGPLFADATDGEWYLNERRMLAEHLTDVLVCRARLRHEMGDVDDCIDLCRQVLGVEPCHESAHRLLMRAYASRGLHHMVARQYSECVRLLRRRLDVPPHPETTSVFHTLVDSRH